MSQRFWDRLRAEIRRAVLDTNFAYTRLAEINRIPVRDQGAELRWERSWRGPRLVGSVLPQQRHGNAEI